MSYIVPTTNNNINTVIYDLNNLSEDILKINGDRKLQKEFNRKINISVYNKYLLKNILFSKTKPLGYLESIKANDYSFENYKKIACLGFDYSNEMSEININTRPTPNSISEKLVCDYKIPVWEETTEERLIRNINRITLVNSFRVYGIMGMLYQASIRNYTTTDDIKKTRHDIVYIYSTLIENDMTNILIPKIKNSLDKMKFLTLDVLSEKSQNAYNITHVKLERKYSAQLISYQLYGELIKTETQLNKFRDIIKNLNSSFPAHALEGNINVVQV